MDSDERLHRTSNPFRQAWAAAALAALLAAGGLTMLFSCKEDVHSEAVLYVGNVLTLDDQFIITAWTTSGMQFPNPAYDKAVIFPPYSTLRAQILERGNPPRVVTAGITVEYRILGNTFTYGKRSYGQFWDNFASLFPAITPPPQDKGMNLVDPGVNNGLSGTMLLKGNLYQADGIPVMPVLDDGSWNPYQVAEITAKGPGDIVIAQTQVTVPVSDEILCSKCHGNDPFADVLAKHDARQGTTLALSGPVLCASCHASPILGQKARINNVTFLSEAIHRFHADKSAECYDCHPGDVTRMSRSREHSNVNHVKKGCENDRCHRTMKEMATNITKNGRIPWQDEPPCEDCHGQIKDANTHDVLFKDGLGHGELGCPSCHQAFHGEVPSLQAPDNYQAIQYQTRNIPLASCAVCHDRSKGQSPFAHYEKEHGGPDPKTPTACMVCHTGFKSDDFDKWPHGFRWRDRSW